MYYLLMCDFNKYGKNGCISQLDSIGFPIDYCRSSGIDELFLGDCAIPFTSTIVYSHMIYLSDLKRFYNWIIFIWDFCVKVYGIHRKKFRQLYLFLIGQIPLWFCQKQQVYLPQWTSQSPHHNHYNSYLCKIFCKCWTEENSH